MKRRDVLRNTVLTAGALALGRAVTATESAQWPAAAGSIKHSACRWCYSDIPLEELCERGQDVGLQSLELLGPKEWPVARKYDLSCAVGNDSWISLTDGFNDPANHKLLQEKYPALIRAAAEAGVPNVIVFSGNRRGISDEAGLENCAKGLEPLVPIAREAGVTLIMELLNSKVNHKDYQCDHTPWGAALVDKVGSPHFKLLYDIYHMQIMEGDVIATIRQYKDYIAHYHTGGVPGRHEINETQELYYPAIVRAIQETGYTGYLGQEFIPTYEDKIAALAEGLKICTV